MHTRTELHEALKEALGSDQVYFQPPASVKMTYPAIVYKQNNFYTHHANSKPYVLRTYYDIIVISPDPDNTITKRVAQLPTATPSRRYVADNLYHDPYTIHI